MTQRRHNSVPRHEHPVQTQFVIELLHTERVLGDYVEVASEPVLPKPSEERTIEETPVTSAVVNPDYPDVRTVMRKSDVPPL